MAKKEIKKPLKKGQGKFQLVGEAKINDFTFKIDEESKHSDWIYNTLNLGVDCGNGNTVYSEMMGGYGSERNNLVYAHGIKEDKTDDYENRFQIDWDDRFDEDILKTIGKQCFITIGIEKDKKGKLFIKNFLSPYDAIAYVQEHLTDGTVITVKGDLKYTTYKDNVQMKKVITSIFLSKADDPSKYSATFSQTVLLNKESVGKLDKEKAIYPITTTIIDYTKEWKDKEVKTNIPFIKMMEVVVDKDKPENTKKLIDKYLKVKKSGYTEIILEGNIVEGQILVNITEADISDEIKELIEMGAYTMEEVTAKMTVGNNQREKRMIIKKPQFRMVGEEGSKEAVVQITQNAYTDEDLLLDFMFEDEEEAPFDTDDTDTDTDENDNDDTDDNSWLKKLDEEEEE